MPPNLEVFRERIMTHSRRARDRAPLLAMNALQRSWVVPRTLRYLILRAWGIRTETRRISEGSWFGGRDISIGRETFVNMGCVFDNLGEVRIGAGCHVGMHVMFLTSTHELGGSAGRAGDLVGKAVVVEDGCWIGAGAIVMPGVTIGRGCVVGSGSVVTKDCEPDGLYVGNPAHRRRDLDGPSR